MNFTGEHKQLETAGMGVAVDEEIGMQGVS